MRSDVVNGKPVCGYTAPGFEPVWETFKQNFSQRGETGASCSVYHHGDLVVNLWGRFRDLATQAPWEEDTLVMVFSTTKGLAAMAVAVAHSRGLLDYDERVAAYWPEFARNGKERITVRQLLAHQAGLCAIDEALDIETLHDLNRLSTILARQKPLILLDPLMHTTSIPLGFMKMSSFAGSIHSTAAWGVSSMMKSLYPWIEILYGPPIGDPKR